MTYPNGTTPHTWGTNLYFKYLIQLAISMLCTVCEGRYEICIESFKDTYDNERECICNQLSTNLLGKILTANPPLVLQHLPQVRQVAMPVGAYH